MWSPEEVLRLLDRVPLRRDASNQRYDQTADRQIQSWCPEESWTPSTPWRTTEIRNSKSAATSNFRFWFRFYLVLADVNEQNPEVCSAKVKSQKSPGFLSRGQIPDVSWVTFYRGFLVASSVKALSAKNAFSACALNSWVGKFISEVSLQVNSNCICGLQG